LEKGPFVIRQDRGAVAAWFYSGIDPDLGQATWTTRAAEAMPYKTRKAAEAAISRESLALGLESRITVIKAK
jgi:hypothetical protein